MFFSLEPFLPVLSEEEKKKLKKGQQPEKIEGDKLLINTKNRELAQGETFELEIEANPRKQEVFQQNLILQVENNPEEMRIPINFNAILPEASISETLLDFEKMILGKNGVKSFEIKNISLTKILWTIKNFEQLSSHFHISQTHGELSINENITVEIQFNAVEERKIEEKLLIEVSSLENPKVKSSQTKEISIKAEGFKILVDFLGFQDPNKLFIDFGETLVNRAVNKVFQMVNNGQYSINVELFFFKKQFEQFFQYEKQKIELPPKGTKDVSIVFKAQEQVQLGTKQKIFLTIKVLEKSTQDVYKEVKVEIKALSQYS